MNTVKNTLFIVALTFAFASQIQGNGKNQAPLLSIEDRLASRDFPSIFQAWYGVDMPEVPIETESQRLSVAARHDVLWEEPLSQLGEGVDLVLGLVWDHKHHGQADSFTKESLAKAKAARNALRKENPNMVTLLEVRWRDAPSDFLPKKSKWWKRDENGEIEVGWTGGWVPFWMLDYENPEFQDNVARQAKIAIESGVYDGIMLDWSGHLEIVKKVRAAIGEEALIVVNIHDNIEHGKKYAKYINGSFMECNPLDETAAVKNNKTTWDSLREAVIWFEDNLRQPTVNCLEVWGNRDDLSRMRATTTLGLVHSDASTLYADPNPLSTPDHYHNWYGFWDADLGKPTSGAYSSETGATLREYESGTVVYNHIGNEAFTITFDSERVRASDGLRGSHFTVPSRDGDIFLLP